MTTQFPTLGKVGLNYHFGWESSEITRTFYLADITKLPEVLNILTGNPSYPVNLPHQHPYPYNSFRCMDVNVVPVDRKAVQGSVYDYNDIAGFLNTLEGTNQSRPCPVNITVIYKPWAAQNQLHDITDETFDFSAQVMSLIGNNPAQDPQTGLHWESLDSLGKPVLVPNVKAAVKIIPKCELMQKRVFLSQVPTSTQLALIGKVNATDFMMMGASGGSGTGSVQLQLWPAETLLCMSMPTIRRFRWDGQFVAECTIKLAANLYKDTIKGPSSGGWPNQYVTFNRLFRPAPIGWWERVYMGSSNTPLYPTADFNILNTIGQ